MILEKLAAQATAESSPHTETLLPGLGAWQRVVVPATSTAVGRSLAELQLRGTTGATVLAIARGDGGVAVPDAREPLRAGDVLAITGTQEAIEAARGMLSA